MSLQKLPSGRWRAQVWDPKANCNVSVSKVLGLRGKEATFATKTEARQAREKARERLEAPRSNVTVAQLAERWIDDPLFHVGPRGPRKESTRVHNAERIKPFVDAYGHLRVNEVSDFIVAQYLTGGRRIATVPALRAMFTDAMSGRAGRIIDRNPFSNLGISRRPGNRHKQPPTQVELANMIAIAHDLTPPSFATYLEVACLTGIRPGELDALQWPEVDFTLREVRIVRQWNARLRKFTDPKYGPYTIALVDQAETVLRSVPRESEFVFTTIRGTHYTTSARSHHWNRVRAAAGLGGMTLYLATRHYFGWYALNVLGLEPSVIAVQLGHKDGGKLVEQLYGHRDHRLSRAKIRDAFGQVGEVRALRPATDKKGHR